MSLRNKLYHHIKTNGEVTYGDMCTFVAREGYKMSYGERELRHLAEEKKIGTKRSKSKRGTEYISAYTIEQPQQKKLEYKIIIENGQPIAKLI